MAPKAKIPAPIDRPLSRAYLREFSGWSTSYPPGLSEPTSLRIMENVQINKEGSCRIRPGLRYLSYETPPTDDAPGEALGYTPVGSHEAFFLNDGTKAYLFAVREDDDTVGFRVLRLTSSTATVQNLTDAGVDFLIPQGESVINFTAATTYVKYLQVDNKVFALSDAGESMRLFNVGELKSVRKILSIETPDWTVADKLTVVHPEAEWISNGIPLSTRTNLLTNPTFANLQGWFDSANAETFLNAAQARTGGFAAEMWSKPTKTNLATNPLSDVSTYGISKWGAAGSDSSLSTSGDDLSLLVPAGATGRRGFAHTEQLSGVKAGQDYHFSVDVDQIGAGSAFRALVRFYGSNGLQVGSDKEFSSTLVFGRYNSPSMEAPSGAVAMRVYIGHQCTSTGNQTAKFKHLVVCNSDESTAWYSGDSGANYFWLGTAGLSQSVYHPPVTISLESEPKTAVPGASSMIASAYLKSGLIGQDSKIGIKWYDADGNFMASHMSANEDLDAAYERVSKSGGGIVPSPTHCTVYLEFANVARGTAIYIDDVLLETGTVLADYFDGSTASVPALAHAWLGTAHESASRETVYSVDNTLPTAETPTAETLISDGSVDHENDFNVGFFYCFTNEVGDSSYSQVTIVKVQRAWNTWRWETANVDGEPSGVETSDPYLAADQLAAYMPEAVFDQAVANRALSWSLYAFTWSNQSAVPIEAVKVAEVKLTETPVYESEGWAVMTPQSTMFDDLAVIPSENSLYNFSNPSHGGQGLVAADRMVMVYDPTEQAVIRWSSNQQGDYTDFTAAKGGGYKTLTSGNLFVPACVKLWQNPQSVDTLTILCLGVDGHSTGYYMAPASVTSQSDNTAIMGFEETTATPGTTSPYGCEVVNNALYHPLDDQLMKSSASNYNINHKPQTDLIQNEWSRLRNKDRIISSLLDTRLYFIVFNPEGEILEQGCNGNEVWVYDTASETGTWSRFLVQGVSLRKIEFGGQVYMSIVKSDGIYYFDPLSETDDYVNDDGDVAQRYIPWRLETNTQGANRAHDAWARLQQLQLSLGNFQGSIRWGIRSWDVNGQPVDKSKIYRDLNDPDLVNNLPFDIDDSLDIGRDLQQWFFYASSVEEDDETLRSYGQINSLQYRYAPVSVNVGYAGGSIETFEYERATTNWDSRTTDAGVPMPMTDTRRP